jgi:aquaporin Z
MPESSTTVQQASAEVLGTFVLVFFGCGTVLMTTQFEGGTNYVATALAFGLTVLVMAYALGRVSGAHFNPAITLGAAVGGRIAWRQVPIYIGAQLLGALAAGLFLFTLMHGFPGFDATGNMAQNSFGDAGSGYAWWAAFLLEMLMTAVFIWVILAVTDVRNEHPALAPLAIGLTLTMLHFGSIAATGTSVNPARSIGVGVFAGVDAVAQLWLFILAPLLGGAIAGITYALLFGRGAEDVPGSGLRLVRIQIAPGAVAPGIAAPGVGAVPGYGAPDQLQEQWNTETDEGQPPS